ncbi:quinoprotein glucose dehydrogenase [Paenibacillus sp. FSL R7-0273]|uniref:PQQ-dependent sugar dehydrogenase n=1 Tax=Paenibacillus sp. FSL R7-0273 TaxID=1536772 RepID=UPI0004F76474|nr:sorbosone dehydrogenase family protein [Paenibacillus sp. FSL R7-0273]AIQ47214.1 quinoprotein glucose dehydrogenase [Paenibacillus sp. FSL R7-0273]OMF91534.1 quinoprotein glucose dehydrogenase [Paenibacillus sp. FSL R7-0273]
MKKSYALSLLAVLMTAGCSSAADEPLLSSQTQPAGHGQQPSAQPVETAVPETAEASDAAVAEPEVVAANLQVPWSIAKAGDILYLTERPGTIVKIEDGTVDRQEVQLAKELATASEAGLLGLVLDPDFAGSGLAYAYYTYTDSSGQFNRIVTLRHDNGIWNEEELLLDKLPSGSVHHGGRLALGPDGKLYATAGDAGDRDIAQDTGSLGGKILRLNTDGSVPEDNPFTDSYVYSYGHRNAQGLVWTGDGVLYASEHGQSSHDEVNEIEAGLNYGWPVIEGDEAREGMVTPLFTSGSDHTWAPSGMAYSEGVLYTAALRGTAILAFDLETGEEREAITGYGRIRDVMIDGDMLYFVSNNTDGRGNPQDGDDKLYRVPLPAL